ncbi:MAG: DUF721 domain-containing protein [Bacteroidales bacterium]|nr:DUF721 domain-containing protein [Bacteroidales bacterium]
MRRTNTQTLGEAIKEYLKAMKIDDKMKEVQLISSWEEIIGKTVARSTREIYIKKGKLFLHINSSVIRNELLMIKDSLLKAMNERAGKNIIDDIIIR